jgi:hypothetical protein
MLACDRMNHVPFPSSEPERPAEEMLRDLEDLDDAVRLKLEIAPPELTTRYEAELAALLSDCRTFVAQANPRARTLIADAIVRYRAFLTTPTHAVDDPA